MRRAYLVRDGGCGERKGLIREEVAIVGRGELKTEIFKVLALSQVVVVVLRKERSPIAANDALEVTVVHLLRELASHSIEERTVCSGSCATAQWHEEPAAV